MAKKDRRKNAPVQQETLPFDPSWKTWIIGAILLLTIIIYSNSTKNGFIYFDDPELVMENFSIRQITWDNLVLYFTTPFQFTYLPVGLISYAIDYQLGGLDPWIYHFNSLLIHLGTVILVYWLFQLLTGKFYISAFTAFIFAIHPVNVDGVAWIAVRNNLLATFFYLGALLAYTFYLKRNFETKYLVIAVCSFALSALSKSSSVVLPLVLFLWDYYYDRPRDKRFFLDKLPFIAISVTLGLLTLNIRGDVVPPGEYNLFDRFILFSSALTDYFYRLLFPFQLSMAYAYPAKEGIFLPWELYLSPFILALIVFGLYKLKVTRKALVIGLLFFVINIFLSHSVFLIDNFKANRYAYLSYIGLFFILADFNEQVLNATEGWKSKIKTFWIAALVVMAIGFSALTYNRNFVWKDTITLFDDVLQKQPDIPWVYSNRGIAKYRNNDLEGALKDFNRSLELDPNFSLSLYYRGVLSHLSGDYEAALADLDQVIFTTPDFSNAYYERGMVRKDLQDYQGALDDLSAAIAANQYFVEAYFDRGILRTDLGDYQNALADYDAVISFDPGHMLAYYNRGIAKSKLADYQGARDDFSKVLELEPNDAPSFYQRSIAKFNLNDLAGACEDVRRAEELGYASSEDEQIKLACP